MYAKLNDEKIKKIKDLESDLGVYLLAEQRFKDLSAADLKTLQDMEKKMGAVLVAYEA
ncbi:conserved hypothetical protein [Methanolacinia petrolearia DSM 11571]|jgi:hypothetical protein|uniref:Uncharacterized protein n=1 Tax=Methanolacinia petrolearia (strain DSM 11571 / OCM 486 / SEBR 4847) TaxID=679926 RepID=E1RDY4_METP4|nr:MULTISPECIES: hypothetical protein [Methanolacinia]ADN34875.1 conserved hypothetical protein [Methanolacinia petrolearia DSM 11571]